MKNIAIIRDSRISSLDHYKYFQNSNVQFISANQNPHDATKYLLPQNITLINAKTYNPFILDPADLIYNKIFNLSWRFIAGLEKLTEKSDVFNISDTYYFWNYQASKIAEQKNVPLVTTIWCNTPHHISSWIPPYSFITKHIVNRTRLFILRNKKALKFTDSLNIPHNKIEIIYEGVDLARFYPENNEHDQTIRILYIGLLDPSKGVTDLLNAFQKLYSNNKNIQLIIAGRGKLKKQIQQLSLTLPIKFYDYVPYHDVPSLYRQADIFCSPSRQVSLANIPLWGEYFSYTLMEAQASGLPIVSTKVGGITEEVDVQNFLVEPQNPQQIYDALHTLVLNYTKRKQLGEYNRKRAEQLFDAEKQALLTEKAILNL